MKTGTMMYRVAVEPKLHIQKIKDTTVYDKYWYRCLGYLMIYHRAPYQQDWRLKGFITPEDLRKLLGASDWDAFVKGERYFTKYVALQEDEVPRVKAQPLNTNPTTLVRVSDGAELKLNDDGETYSFVEGRSKKKPRWTYEHLMDSDRFKGAFKVKEKITQ